MRRKFVWAAVAAVSLLGGGGAGWSLMSWSGVAEAQQPVDPAAPIARPVVQPQNGAPLAPTFPAQPGAYTVVGVGDTMLGSDWPTPIMDPRVTPDADPAAVLGPEISGLFHSANVVFGNFEGTMHTNSDSAKSCNNPAVCYTFRSPPFHAAYLRRAGFTLLSNANNHSRDFGEANRAITYRNLTGAGIGVSGADTDGTRLAVQTLPDGTRFALIAFGHNPGLMQVTRLRPVAADGGAGAAPSRRRDRFLPHRCRGADQRASDPRARDIRGREPR